MADSKYQRHDAILLAHRAAPERWALLSADEKRALRLLYFRWLTQAQAGRMMGLPPKRLRALIGGALGKLGAWRFIGQYHHARPGDRPLDWGGAGDDRKEGVA